MTDSLYGFEPYRLNSVDERGIQILYRFPNGYGASVVPSHGDDEREIAVIRWIDGVNEWGWESDHTTPVMPFPQRYLVGYIEPTLREISELPEADQR